MSVNPVADILEPYIADRDEGTRRVCEDRLFDYAMARGCDFWSDVFAHTRLRNVTSVVRRGDYSEAWMRGALDALRDAIDSSRARAEELRRRVDEALRKPPVVMLRPPYDSAEMFVGGSRLPAPTLSVEYRRASETVEPVFTVEVFRDAMATLGRRAPTPTEFVPSYLTSPQERERAEASAYASAETVRVEAADGRVIGEARTIGTTFGPFLSGPVRAVLSLESATDITDAFDEGSEIAEMFRTARERTNPALATGDDLDRLAQIFDMERVPSESDARLRERILNPLRIFSVARQTDTATQIREAINREAWRARIRAAIGAGEFRHRSCAACGGWSFPCVLCVECSGVDRPWERLRATPSALAAWRQRLYVRALTSPEHSPLNIRGGACASRLYPEAPRAHDAVRLRCPLRRSPMRPTCVAMTLRCAVTCNDVAARGVEGT